MSPEMTVLIMINLKRIIQYFICEGHIYVCLRNWCFIAGNDCTLKFGLAGRPCIESCQIHLSSKGVTFKWSLSVTVLSLSSFVSIFGLFRKIEKQHYYDCKLFPFQTVSFLNRIKSASIIFF